MHFDDGMVVFVEEYFVRWTRGRKYVFLEVMFVEDFGIVRNRSEFVFCLVGILRQ
jgi:hypothetical protein